MKTARALLVSSCAAALLAVRSDAALASGPTSQSFLAFKAQHGLRALETVSLSPFENCLSSNRSLSGDVYFTPSTAGYADFATGVNSRIDRHPAAVFFAQTENDVVSAINCAVRNGLQPVPRGGGHSYEVLSSMDGSLVIDLASMNAVTILSRDDASQTAIASVQGGARLGTVYKEIFRQGQYNFNAGTCPGVGIGGHVSGGGYGMVSRKYGMAADMVVGLRVVLASGQIVDATETQNSDLFWALRGGGAGSFGIVTEFRIKVHKIPQSTMFTIYYDNTVTAQLIRKWMDFFPTATDRITTQMNVDRDGTTFRGQFLGPLWELTELLDTSGMTAVGGIKYDVRTDQCNALETKAFMWGDSCANMAVLDTPTHPGRNEKGYAKLKSAYASTKLSDAGIRVVIDQLNQAPRDGNWIQFEAFGGVFSTKPVSYTPWAGRDATFSVQLYVNAQKGESSNSTGRQWIRGFADALAPYMNGHAYQNYCDLEIGPNYGEVYWGKDNFARLKQIKQVYDPLNIFKNEQSVPLP